MRKLYKIASFSAYPLISLWIKNRAAKGKEDPARLRERHGHLSISRPKGKVIWVHAASVGESNSVMPLLNKLHDADETLHIVMTTGTVTSAKMMAGRLPDRAYHQFVPIDVPFVVSRFLNKLKPDLAIWVESEFWPNLLYATAQRNIPLYLVNARISDTSFRRWLNLRSVFADMMRCFTGIYAGSQSDKQKLHQLGASKVEWAGNLKYDAPTLSADPKQTSAVLENIGDRRIWLASSTHPGEEEMVAEVHRKVREVFPDLLTLLVPRHPDRRDEICAMLKREKLTTALRSKGHMILPETDVYLADTIGELGIFYRLSGVVFMGGSLVPHGGHNPIEPAQLDSAVLCGPYMHSFTNIVEDLKTSQSLTEVRDVDALAEQVIELLRDHDAQEAMAARAHQAVDAKRGAADIIAKTIMEKMGIAQTEEAEVESEEQEEGGL